ncbi:MAG: glucose-1-phosphate cytidylyltransferase [Planctomycetes bacterium]|nr:glucose-1-phosphate cytidylyltransferase [Planctomycetota bacterium]
MTSLKVAILCGGYGTRIRDVADNIPKAMIPVGANPILWHIMKYYAHFNHNKFILCLGHKGESIRDFFLNYETNMCDITVTLGGEISYHEKISEAGWDVTLAKTGLHSMTGARVKCIEKYLNKDKNFMLTYGDGVGDINLDKLLKFHLAHGKILTVTGVRPPGRFGELNSDSKGLVTEFNEKPQAIAGLISGGFFVCRKELFDYLNNREDLVFEQEPMRQLVKDNQMMVYKHEGFWQPMDTYRDYTLLNNLYNKGNAPWMIW